MLTVTATTASDYRFTGWTGVDAKYESTTPADVTMDEDKTISAVFMKKKYTLNVTASPTAGGSVGVTGTDISGGSPYTVDHGTEVTLTATANGGYKFTGWSGAGSGSNTTAYVRMNSNKNITATFTETGPAIGDRGPGGGWIFKDTVSGKYYEVAEKLGESGWKGDVDWHEAPALARAHRGGGKTDWYLPNKDLLNEIWLVKKDLENKGFPHYRGFFWYSSESEKSNHQGKLWAWAQHFDDFGRQNIAGKTTERSVLAVKALNP